MLIGVWLKRELN